MALYAIGDLHLSGKVDKPMDIFGHHWSAHDERIKDHWLKVVKERDTVLIPGDISWAMTMEEAIVDLKWINDLPGNKILIKGNHDYWWGSISKLNNLFDSMMFVQNNFFTYEEYGICGTRGWICPNIHRFTAHDEKVYLREIHRLKISLDKAKEKGYNRLIVMLHYPPTNDQLEPSLFTETFEYYGVDHVIYGHLHGEASYGAGLQGLYNNVHYHLVSCDFLDFKLAKIL